MRLQQVRNTIATDLHDDIGSAFTNISILAELSEIKISKKYLPKTYQDEFQKNQH